MALTVTLNNGKAKLGDVVDYSVTEDATPLTIGDSGGSVGQLKVTARAKTTGPVHLRSGAVVGDEIFLTESSPIDGTPVKGRGEIRGNITEASMPGERVSLTAETALARFNAERTAKPFYGVYQPPTTTVSYRTNYATNPSREVNIDGVVLNLAGGGGAATLTRQTTGGMFGNAFARVTWTTPDTVWDGGMYDIVTGIVPNTSYTVSGYYRATRAIAVDPGTIVQRLRMIVRFYNSQGTPLNDQNVYFNVAQGEWTRATASFEAPSAAVSLRIYCVSGQGDGWANWKTGDTLDSDGILVERAGLGDFFDGSTPTDTVVNEEGNLTTTATHGWSGAAGNSLSIQTITKTQMRGTGYDATQGAYFRYLCELVGIPAVRVEGDFDNIPVAYPGWTGNVWKYLKDFVAAIRAEVAFIDDTIVLRKPRTREIPLESVSNPVLSVNSALSSQFVQVYNYNSSWGNGQNIFDATTVYQVDAGSSTIVDITVPHFVESVNNPTAVDYYNTLLVSGAGQYSIVDSQGLRVAASWWTQNGGNIEAELLPGSNNNIRVTITGARFSPEAYVGPFRIGRDAGDIIPALNLTGTGVFIDKQLVRIRTGVSAEQTSTIDGSAIDNVFLSNADLAYTRGLDAATTAAGPVVSFTGVIGYDILASGQEFGVIAGSRVKYADNIFRITNVSYSSKGISFTAVGDMIFSDAVDLYSFTFAEFNVAYTGFTFATFNAANPGTFTMFNNSFGNPTFELFNEIYANATFNDHATYPYISEPQSEATS